jgi:hypothetical protein
MQELVRSRAAVEADTTSLSALGLFRADDLRRPVRELSLCQQRRLDLAIALAGRPHVLLLDVPTNHLSIALVDELTEALQATAAAVVAATHDRQMQRDLATWPPGLGSTSRASAGRGMPRTSPRDSRRAPAGSGSTGNISSRDRVVVPAAVLVSDDDRC